MDKLFLADLTLHSAKSEDSVSLILVFIEMIITARFILIVITMKVTVITVKIPVVFVGSLTFLLCYVIHLLLRFVPTETEALDSVFISVKFGHVN